MAGFVSSSSSFLGESFPLLLSSCAEAWRARQALSSSASFVSGRNFFSLIVEIKKETAEKKRPHEKSFFQGGLNERFLWKHGGKKRGRNRRRRARESSSTSFKTVE